MPTATPDATRCKCQMQMPTAKMPDARRCGCQNEHPTPNGRVGANMWRRTCGTWHSRRGARNEGAGDDRERCNALSMRRYAAPCYAMLCYAISDAGLTPSAAVNHVPEELGRPESRIRDSGRDSGFMNYDESRCSRGRGSGGNFKSSQGHCASLSYFGSRRPRRPEDGPCSAAPARQRWPRAPRRRSRSRSWPPSLSWPLHRAARRCAARARPAATKRRRPLSSRRPPRRRRSCAPTT